MHRAGKAQGRILLHQDAADVLPAHAIALQPGNGKSTLQAWSAAWPLPGHIQADARCFQAACLAGSDMAAAEFDSAAAAEISPEDVFHFGIAAAVLGPGAVACQLQLGSRHAAGRAGMQALRITSQGGIQVQAGPAANPRPG